MRRNKEVSAGSHRACLILALAVAAGAAQGALPLPDASRIDAIARLLPAEPGFPELNITNRVFWDKARREPGAAYAIAQAEKLLDSPVVDPDDAVYEQIYAWAKTSADNGTALRILALAECLENKGRFLPRVVAYIESRSAQTTWMNPYHDRPSFGNFHGKYRSTDLDTADRAEILAIALDNLRGKLPADVEARATAALWKQCYSNYLAKADAPEASGTRGINTWFFGDSNWNVACHGWCVAAAVRTISDVRTRARFIEAAERAYPCYLNGFSSDGYCHEGMDYWNFGYGMFLHLAWTVRSATGGQVDFFAHPMARKDFLYAFECMMTDKVTLRYGDGAAGGPSTDNLFLGGLVWPELMTAAGRGCGTKLNSPGCHPYRTLPMLMDRVASGDAKPYRRPPRSFFPDAQVLVCRPGNHSGDALTACIRGGHNACPHNHNDVGQYAVAIGDIPFVEDPAGAIYTLKTFSAQRYEIPILNSYSHAVPRPDGTLQGAGRKYASKITGHGFSDRLDWLEMDLAACYPMTNAARLAKLTRRFEYDRADGAVTVEDAVAFTVPAAFETSFSTFGRVLAGTNANTFVIMRANASGEARLAFTVDTHGAKWHVREEIVENPRRESPRRWAVVLDEPAREAKVTIRYRADRGDLVQPNDRVVFLRDPAASGGASGEYVNLFYATRYPGSDRSFAGLDGSAERFLTGDAAIDGALSAMKATAVIVPDDGDGALEFLDRCLRELHAPGTVDEIRTSVYKKNACSITSCARALPFPADENLTRCPGFAAFAENFNREILRIEGLVPGTYRVTVDGREIGLWSARELGMGVNVATNAATPQYRQALKVRDLVARLWARETTEAEAARLRDEIKTTAKPVAHTFKAVEIDGRTSAQP